MCSSVLSMPDVQEGMTSRGRALKKRAFSIVGTSTEASVRLLLLCIYKKTLHFYSIVHITLVVTSRRL